MKRPPRPLPVDPAVPLDFTEFMDSVEDHAKAFVRRERAYLLARVMDKAAAGISKLIPLLAFLVLLVIGVLLALIAVANYWGEQVGNVTQGYAYTAACVIGVALLVQVIRGVVSRSLHASLAKSFLEDAIGPSDADAKFQLAELRAERDEEKHHLKAQPIQL